MPYVSFFGATGGCTLAALARTLDANIDAVALVRSSQKLVKLLGEKGVSASTISSYLTIIEGNIKDTASVQKALLCPGRPDRVTDIIVSGIGGSPQLQFSLWQPVILDDPHTCEKATRNILQALGELHKSGAATGEPICAMVSTTGITDGPRDVPLAFYALYHWLLAVPHADKRLMEQLLLETSVNSETSPIKGFVSVRPSLLVDGVAQSSDKVRVGWESPKEAAPGPAVGYTITRDNVGAWLFENIIKSSDREHWLDRMVTLTF